MFDLDGAVDSGKRSRDPQKYSNASDHDVHHYKMGLCTVSHLKTVPTQQFTLSSCPFPLLPSLRVPSSPSLLTRPLTEYPTLVLKTVSRLLRVCLELVKIYLMCQRTKSVSSRKPKLATMLWPVWSLILHLKAAPQCLRMRSVTKLVGRYISSCHYLLTQASVS